MPLAERMPQAERAPRVRRRAEGHAGAEATVAARASARASGCGPSRPAASGRPRSPASSGRRRGALAISSRRRAYSGAVHLLARQPAVAVAAAHAQHARKVRAHEEARRPALVERKVEDGVAQLPVFALERDGMPRLSQSMRRCAALPRAGRRARRRAGRRARCSRAGRCRCRGSRGPSRGGRGSRRSVRATSDGGGSARSPTCRGRRAEIESPAGHDRHRVESASIECRVFAAGTNSGGPQPLRREAHEMVGHPDRVGTERGASRMPP